MSDDWGIIGCAYMAKEYCKVLTAKGIDPNVYSRDLASSNVKSFEEMFTDLRVQGFDEISNAVDKWIVCTNIESHEQVCSMLEGRIYCEKPYSHVPTYDASKEISILMNRRYYYWVEFMRGIIDEGKIVKVIACIPERSVDA